MSKPSVGSLAVNRMSATSPSDFGISRSAARCAASSGQ
jgi:hypothetical protein